MDKLNLNYSKIDGQTLSANEWNDIIGGIQDKTNAIIDEVAAIDTTSGSGSSVDSSYMYVNDKGNLTIETTPDNVPAGKKGKINIESNDDVQIKPGDDLIVTSSHRPVDKLDEVSVKIHDGEDHPVKLQLNAADIVLTTKDKDATKTKDANGDDTTTAMYDDPNVMNVTVNSGKNTRGYLKVRAQAIDLRCEDHGGVALQPKGEDGQGNMNKIKFEHGGGDGLEFGTFNTEKTSIFTNEYRFNKDGVWKMATRTTTVSDKYDNEDETTHYKYTKQADDFYDVINSSDATATTEQIIKAANIVSPSDLSYNINTGGGFILDGGPEYWSFAIVHKQVMTGNILSDYDEVFPVSYDNQSNNDTHYYTLYSKSNWNAYFNGFASYISPDSLATKLGITTQELNQGLHTGDFVFVTVYEQSQEQKTEAFQSSQTYEEAEVNCCVYVLKYVETVGEIGVDLRGGHMGIENLGNIVLAPNTSAQGLVIIPSGSLITSGNAQSGCDIDDLINLVNYFKTNNLGPWQNSGT